MWWLMLSFCLFSAMFLYSCIVFLCVCVKQRSALILFLVSCSLCIGFIFYFQFEIFERSVIVAIITLLEIAIAISSLFLQ